MQTRIPYQLPATARDTSEQGGPPDNSDELSASLRLIRPADAARILAISRSKCYELIKAHQLPHVRIGNSIRIPAQALARYLKERTQEAVEE